MPYATQQDMIKAFGEREIVALTDRERTGALNAAVLDHALEQADGEINPYLVNRVNIPLSVVPPILVTHACNIARYRLTGSEAMETEIIERRYKDAMRFLEMVAAGKVSLGVDAQGEQPTPPTGGAVQFSSGGHVFSRESTSRS